MVKDAPEARGFVRALTEGRRHPRFGVIAEVKRRSPSAGWMRDAYKPARDRDGFDPAVIAASYQRAGASAVSCLTERRFFAGDPGFIGRIRTLVELPVLRKDFLVDPYQVFQARAIGADAVLLIAECLPGPELGEMADLALDLGMDVLIEAHAEHQFERITPLAGPGTLLGINNRDLEAMKTDLEHTLRAARRMEDPSRLVSESGIRSGEDLRRLASAGIGLVLIGEHLMKTEDPGATLAALLASAD